MSYRLKIYGALGTGTPVTTLSTPDFTVIGWAKAVNGARNMAFALHAQNAKATPEYLRKERQIVLLRLSRDGTSVYLPVWRGFIQAEREAGGRKEITCRGLLDRLAKRYTAAGEAFTGQGSTEVFGLLADANGTGDTGIVAGTGGVTTTRSVTAQGAVPVLAMLEKLAQAHDAAEYEIDDDAALNFVPTIGADQSATVELVFRRDGTPGTNVDEIELGEDSRDLANRVIGFSSAFVGAGNPYTANDTASQTDHGIILVERKQFNEAQNATALAAMTETYLTQVGNPITDFRVVPTLASKKFVTSSGERALSGLQYGDVAVGDLVTVTVLTGNTSISEVKRIAELSVSVSQAGTERLAFTFAKPGVFVTAGLLEAEEVRRLKRRVQEIDALL